MGMLAVDSFSGLAGLALAAAVGWAGLLGWRGRFWRCEAVLDPEAADLPQGALPPVVAVVPARDEAEVLGETLLSLLTQNYPGLLHIVLVDDRSGDGTGALAEALARAYGCEERLTVVPGETLLPGWSGKLWAIEQGLRRGEALEPEYWLLTDADICHHPDNLAALVQKAQQENRDLVSLMVHLRCRDAWEVLLIPAFVFFFQKLYPFFWVNDPNDSTAAAAGGCILVRRTALDRAGGIADIRDCLIDDCALAVQVKRTGGNLWLGLTRRTRSLRSYTGLGQIWKMVARTAFTQLDYSPALLALTVAAMVLLYLVPPTAFLAGGLTASPLLVALGGAGWLAMAVAYGPTLRFYELPPWLAPALPVIAALYTAMTVDSAWRHWLGEGGSWKGRVYPNARRRD